MRRSVGLVAIAFGAWTALAVFFSISTSLTYVSQGRPAIWPLTLAIELAQWWVWALLTPIVLWAATRAPLTRGRVARSMIVHLPLAAACALATVFAQTQMRVWLFHVRPYLLISNLALQFLIYGCLVAVAHALEHYGRIRARSADIEARLDQARLQLLQAQLRPHFLFNALNTIAELIHEDPQRADAMIGRLSALLRATLDAGARSTVPLDQELSLVGHYLAIQQARFGERLSVRIDVPDACRVVPVPHLLLQPLVENAVRHGLAPRAAGGTVTLGASLTGPRLTLTVEDDGVGVPIEGAPEGIGLSNTRARLASLYGAHASLVVIRREGGGTAANLTMPAVDPVAHP